MKRGFVLRCRCRRSGGGGRKRRGKRGREARPSDWGPGDPPPIMPMVSSFLLLGFSGRMRELPAYGREIEMLHYEVVPESGETGGGIRDKLSSIWRM